MAKQYRTEPLSENLSILLQCIYLPLAIIFSNGFSVFFSRVFHLSADCYFPLFFLIFVGALFIARDGLKLKFIATFLKFILLSAGLSIVFLNYFDSSIGTDSALYINKSISDVVSGRFDESSLILERYDEGYSTLYWLNSTLEYPIYYLVHLFKLDYKFNFYLMSLLSLTLLIYSVLLSFLLLKGSFFKWISFIIILFFMVLYMSNDMRSYTAMAFFRSFDHKSIIYGYFMIISFYFYLFFLGGSSHYGKVTYASSLLLPLSAFFVSSNYVVLFIFFLLNFFVFLICGIKFGDRLTNGFKVGLTSLFSFLLLIFYQLYYGASDIYKSLDTRGSNFLMKSDSHAFHYEIASEGYHLSVFVILFFLFIYYFPRLHNIAQGFRNDKGFSSTEVIDKVPVFLLVYVTSMVIVHSEFSFSLFKRYFDGHHLVYWRIMLVFNVFIIFFCVGIFCIGSRLGNIRRTLFYAWSLIFILYLVTTGNVNNPYGRRSVASHVEYVAEVCRKGKFISDQHSNIYIVLLNPYIKPLILRDYFLIYELSKLPFDSPNRIRGERVLQASYYLSGRTDDASDLMLLTEQQSFDLLAIRKKFMFPELGRKLRNHGYERQSFKGYLIFYKQGLCEF